MTIAFKKIFKIFKIEYIDFYVAACSFQIIFKKEMDWLIQMHTSNETLKTFTID